MEEESEREEKDVVLTGVKEDREYGSIEVRVVLVGVF